jgi:periplasmic divalent cation tolerance protein
MYIIVFVTTGSLEEANKIARKLIEDKAAACVNIIKGIDSIYWWKNKIETDQENLLIIKTSEEKYQQIEEIILENHSYENPEIISFQIRKGSEKYLSWITDSIKR